MHDVIIIGGSYAGISAAIQLGRARRTVLVVDGARPRNRFAEHSHGFLGQDGQAPARIAAIGRAEALRYSTVAWREATVRRTKRAGDGFVVEIESDEVRARRIVLATGMVDVAPRISGIDERWGKTIFQCPYCHGYELELGRLGALATSPQSIHHAMLVAEWAAPGGMTLYLNGVDLASEDRAELERRRIRVERELVERVGGAAPAVDVVLRDGRVDELRGLFLLPETRIGVPFPEELGCELEQGPLGPFIKTDMTKETTAPGVFACGDVARPFGAVSLAVADGTMAGSGVHRSLVFPPAPAPSTRS